MKLKNSSKESMYPLLLWIFSIGVLVSAAIRTYQTLFLIEPDTGFYSSVNASVFIINILLAGLGIAFIALSYISKDNMEYKAPEKKTALGVVSIGAFAVFAAGVIYNAVSLKSAETKNVLFIIQTVFQLLSALFFVSYASICFKGASAAKYSLGFILPALWAAFRLLSIFMMATTFINVSTLLFELFALAFIMLFFFALGRTVGSVEDERIRWRVMGFGFPCALFCYISSIPELIAICAGKGVIADTNILSCGCYLMIAIFVTAYLFTLSKKD